MRKIQPITIKLRKPRNPIALAAKKRRASTFKDRRKETDWRREEDVSKGKLPPKL